MKRIFSLLLAAAMLAGLAACAAPAQNAPAEDSTLVYGSGDYTRINPAMDEHGEINLLLFNGLTAHDGENNVVPGLAESWDYDEAACTYTFRLRSGLTWHDGERVTAQDVKFTIESIMDPDARRAAYADFQTALAADPAYAFICYIDANYVASSKLHGISAQTVMGHHGVGVFWNVDTWTIEA